MHDPRLPEHENLYIQSDHEALQGKMVDSLLRTDSMWWDEDLVRDILLSGMLI